MNRRILAAGFSLRRVVWMNRPTAIAGIVYYMEEQEFWFGIC